MTDKGPQRALSSVDDHRTSAYASPDFDKGYFALCRCGWKGTRWDRKGLAISEGKEHVERNRLIPSDVAVDLDMPLHRLDLDDHGRGQWTCDAPIGAKCRLQCAQDCGAEQWPCSDFSDKDGEEILPAHPMHDSGECHVVLFLGLGEPEESYETGRPVNLRSGLVRTTWEGDYYSWTYAEPLSSDEPDEPTDASPGNAGSTPQEAS